MEAEVGIWLSPVNRAFVEKAMDVVGLYLEPPERALALSVDGAASSEALPSSRPRSKTITMITVSTITILTIAMPTRSHEFGLSLRLPSSKKCAEGG